MNFKKKDNSEIGFLNSLEFITYALVGIVAFFFWDGKYYAIIIISAIVFMIGMYILLFHPKTHYRRILKPIPPDSNVPYAIIVSVLGLAGIIYSFLKIKPF